MIKTIILTLVIGVVLFEIHKPPATFKFRSMIGALPVTVEPFQFSPAQPVAYELS
jgi:hypothetical protein